MTLEEAINHAKEKAADKNCSCSEEHKQLAEWLKKLKAKELPRPVIRDGNGKFTRDYSSRDWFLKLQEEVFELQRAYNLKEVNYGKVSDIDEELANIITVCISWLESLGVNEKQRSELFAKVNEKNEKRGYFKERD